MVPKGMKQTECTSIHYEGGYFLVLWPGVLKSALLSRSSAMIPLAKTQTIPPRLRSPLFQDLAITMRFLTIAVTALAAIPCGLAIPDGKPSKLVSTNKNTNNNVQSVGKANTLDRLGLSTAKTNDLLSKANELAGNVKANNRKTKTTNTETVRPELKAEVLCEILEALADEIDKIYIIVKKLDCGCDSSDRWEKIRDDLYLIESYLNQVNNYYIDPSDLSKCFECREESKIACCYRRVCDPSLP